MASDDWQSNANRSTHTTVILRAARLRGVSKDRREYLRSGSSFEARPEEGRAPQDDGSG